MLRAFTDATGLAWRVWDVVPSTTNIRYTAESGSSLAGTAFATGWLCFESDREKRRLAPIPGDWQARADEELAELCARADLVPVRERRMTHAPS